MEFYNSKTGERIPDDLIKKAFAGEIKLDNVSIGNRNMGSTSPVQEPEIAKVEETPKKVQEEPEFEFFKMVNDHADDVKAREVLSSYEAVTHRDTNPRTPQKPEVKRNEAGTTLYYKALNASISLSKGDEPSKNLPKRDRNRKSKIGTTIIALALTGIITITAYAGIEKVAKKVNEGKDLSATRESISTVLSDSNDSTSIVKRHTHRTDDKQGFWFDNFAMAEDLINKLPDEAFDAALYTIYLDMGRNVSNEYIDNFGRVINACGTIASPSDDPIAYSRTNNCHNFEEFARKNGFVDANGEPSMEAYKAFGITSVKSYHNFGVNVVTEEGPEMGGRQ